jgi:hypothetical protein
MSLSRKRLHVVCLDVPYPANYGGASEMFNKLLALHAEGVEVILHCYDYGKGRQPALQRYASEIHYYERGTGHKGVSMTLPYIVASRASRELVANLSRDDHPILFEGIHTTYPLHQGLLKGRRCYVRLHNIEHAYYRQMSRHSRDPIRKTYSFFESLLLERYERELAGMATLLPISGREAAKIGKENPSADVRPLPAFIGLGKTESESGMGNFCLYHGNLSVAENEKAATWLLRKVFNDMPVPLVVAGKAPSARLRRLAHREQHTCIVSDPSDNEMQDMVKKAQIHVLPSFSDTGVKFKLLNAVFRGRHVLTNETMVAGTGIESACHLANGADAFKSVVTQLYRKPFEEEELVLRERLREMHHDDGTNARRLISWIW